MTNATVAAGGPGAWTASAPGAVAPLVRVLPFGLVPLSVVLWALSLGSIDVEAMDDTGLVSVVPAQMWVAFGLLCLSFAVTLVRAEGRGLLLTLHVLAFVVMFYSIPALINDAPRGPIAFRHAGITETLMRTGEVDDTIDAYFNWPGLFMLLGSATGLSGLTSAISFGAWASVALNIAYLAPLYLLLRRFTSDQRLLWAAIWTFYVVNWIDQDYLAPQGFTYLLYLAVLAILVTWFQPRSGEDITRAAAWVRDKARIGWGEEVAAPVTAARVAPVLLVTVVLMYLAATASHQLTPFAILAATTALVVTGQCRATSLPVIMGVIVTTWFLFVAHGFIAGHLETLVGDIGDVRSVASKNVAGRVGGSADHQFVVATRLALSGLVWGLAGIGVLRRLRAHKPDHVALTLLLAPVPLMLITPYGGEMLLRIYFFMLPLTAFFAAAALLPAEKAEPRSGRRHPIRTSAVVAAYAAVLLALVATSTIARYGNQRMDTFSANEVAAVDRLYQLAEPRAVLAVSIEHLPWKYQDYELHEYVSAERIWNREPTLTPAEVVARLEGLLNERPGRPQGYVILTDSERVHAELLGGPSRADLDGFESALAASPRFRLVYSNPEAKIYTRIPGR